MKALISKTLIITLISVVIYGCCTPIALIEKNPEQYYDKEVKVRGKVINTIRLEDLSFFTIKDKGARINVVTENFLPVINDIVVVKGLVDDKFYYQRDTMIVIHESVNNNPKKTNINQAVN